MQETEDVVRACRAAIRRAKQRGSDKVTPEDLLVGILQAIARFGIAFIGPWAIDLEALGEAPVEDGPSLICCNRYLKEPCPFPSR